MKKILALSLAVLMALTLLAACGAGTTASPSPSASASAKPSAAPSSAAPSSAAPSTAPSSAAPSSAAPSAALTGNITASGSTALQPLLNLAIDPFKKATNFTGSITINGGGSGQGLTDVAAGTVNIGNSDVTAAEAGKDATGLVDNVVCVVGVGIAVSKDVAANLTSISKADLIGIFTGKITDWNKVAGWKGASAPIQVFYRKAGSGTRTLFEGFTGAKLSDADLGKFQNFTKKESSGDLESAIASGKGAIGYETLPYCKSLTLLQLDGVAATYDNIYSGKYGMWGYEHMFTKGAPTGAVKAFIEFVASADFGKVVADSGYGLVSKMTVKR